MVSVQVCKDVIAKYQEIEGNDTKEEPNKLSQQGINIAF